MSYNLNAYNASAYNQAAPAPASVVAPTSLLTFDDFNCDDRAAMTISRLVFSSGHKRDIDRFNIPRANGIRVANVNDREKVIKAFGKADAADADAMETLIDTIKKNLRRNRRRLVTNWGGKLRVYEHATLTNMDELFSDRQGYHIDSVPFVLEFLCEEYATDWSYDQWSEEITAAEDTIVTEGLGTVEGKPVIVVSFSAASGVTTLTITIDENGHTIGYEGTINAGDVFIFDCETSTVQKNGTDVDFFGYFPEMVLETNTFRFTTDGASRTFRPTIKSKHAYL